MALCTGPQRQRQSEQGSVVRVLGERRRSASSPGRAPERVRELLSVVLSV